MKQVGDSPRHQGYLRTSLALPHAVALDATLRYVDHLPNQGVPTSSTCDARLGWQPSAALDLALVGENLLDAHHPEFGTLARRRDVRRSLYGKVTCRF